MGHRLFEGTSAGLSEGSTGVNQAIVVRVGA